MPGRRVVIITDGESDDVALRRALGPASALRPLIIAADGGADRAELAEVAVDLVVGDGDSLGLAAIERLRREGVRVELAPVDKDQSDTELAVLAAVGRGAGEIRLVGALGGARPEHAVANLLLLAHPALDGLDVALLVRWSTLRRVGSADGPGSLELQGATGDYVSLLALDSVVEGVRTEGLRFPLKGESLTPGPARGLSNELLGGTARVSCARGRLIVVHTPRQEEELP